MSFEQLLKFDSPRHTLWAEKCGRTYYLSIGNPNFDPKIPTNREWLEEHEDLEISEMADEDFEEHLWWADRSDPRFLDDPMPLDIFLEDGCRNNSPTANAYHFLVDLDLGPVLWPTGGLSLIDGACPGNDSLVVEAQDLETVRLLQLKLLELGYPCNFVVDNGW